MYKIKSKILPLFDQRLDTQVQGQFGQVVNYIDNIISEGYQKSDDERTQFLIRRLISLREYMSKTLYENGLRQVLLKQMQDVFDELEQEDESKSEAKKSKKKLSQEAEFQSDQ